MLLEKAAHSLVFLPVDAAPQSLMALSISGFSELVSRTFVNVAIDCPSNRMTLQDLHAFGKVIAKGGPRIIGPH